MSATMELKAGRELDALIAEKVMGGEWRAYAPPSELVGKSATGLALYLPGDRWMASYFFREGSGYPSDVLQTTNELPHYSTDISDAWKIVEKMEEDCILACVARLTIGWTVSFADWDNTLATETRASAPLAICLAALQAVGSGASSR